jgi:CubicO group peptidase (beta-lactamase class C family)
LFALVGPGTVVAQTAAASGVPFDTAGIPPATVSRIDSAISALMSREHIPGVSIAIVTGNRLRLTRAYGLADVENFVPATPEARFRIASLTKSLTATAVMQLVERGKMSLDDPIQRYVPEYPAKPYPVTIRRLLNHTSGVRHYAGNEEENTRQYDSLVKALDIFKADSLLHPPGATATYSSYGYVLLGLAIERASGMRYMDYLQRHILEPAGMSGAGADDASAIIEARARGYGKTSSGGLRNALAVNTSYVLPAGGVIATAADLAKFFVALQTDRLMTDSSRRIMLAPARLNDGKEVPLAFGFAVSRLPNSRPGLVWNGGNRQGATGMLYTHPDARYAFVILTNLEEIGTPLLNAARDITEIVLH